MTQRAIQPDEMRALELERERVVWIRSQAFVLLLMVVASATFASQFVGRAIEHRDNQLPVDLVVDLNVATQAELNLLPGVGEKLAGDILKYREEVGGFQSVDELMNIRGIKEGRLLSLKKNVTVSSEYRVMKR